jgi:hypothetical protein
MGLPVEKSRRQCADAAATGTPPWTEQRILMSRKPSSSFTVLYRDSARSFLGTIALCFFELGQEARGLLVQVKLEDQRWMGIGVPSTVSS